MTTALVTDLTRVINSLPYGRHNLKITTGSSSVVVKCSGALPSVEQDPWTPQDIEILYTQLENLDHDNEEGSLKITSVVFHQGSNITLSSVSRWDAASGHFLQETTSVDKIQVILLPPREVSEAEFDRIHAEKRARFQTRVR